MAAADQALKLASGDLTKIKAKAEKEAKVAEAQFALTQAESNKELAKEEEERQKALHAENVKNAKALVKKRKEEYDVDSSSPRPRQLGKLREMRRTPSFPRTSLW